MRVADSTQGPIKRGLGTRLGVVTAQQELSPLEV